MAQCRVELGLGGRDSARASANGSASASEESCEFETLALVNSEGFAVGDELLWSRPAVHPPAHPPTSGDPESG